MLISVKFGDVSTSPLTVFCDDSNVVFVLLQEMVDQLRADVARSANDGYVLEKLRHFVFLLPPEYGSASGKNLYKAISHQSFVIIISRISFAYRGTSHLFNHTHLQNLALNRKI